MLLSTMLLLLMHLSPMLLPDAAPDDAAPDTATPDAAPDHVCTALRKALNACGHDCNVYRTLRSDFLRNIGISGGENTNVTAKAWTLLERQAIKLADA